MSKRYLLLLTMLHGAAPAADWNWSGFGTAGYAISDQPYRYQRYIDNRGTVQRDSILAGQLDLKASPALAMTLQARLAPASGSDTDWSATMAWAFVSWRPQDDWLLRVGKLRIPLMLNTENQNVGMTYEFARLPVEVYSTSPMTEVTGLSISKTWLAEQADWTLEGYAGETKTDVRYYGREMQQSSQSPGAFYLKTNIRGGGVVLTVQGADSQFRIGMHQAEVRGDGRPIYAGTVYQMLAPGVGVYGVGGQELDRLLIPVQTAGGSIFLPGHIKLTSEYARMHVGGASEGFSRWGAYLALSRQWGSWTPYAYYARMKSPAGTLAKYRAIDGNTLPALPPPYDTALLNRSQKLAADILSPYDQWTGALGAAYRLTPNQVLKAEWSHTESGVVSSLIDAPSGSNSANRRINVFSLSCSFTF